MRTVIELFYGIGLGGIALQFMPGVPDYVSMSMVICGLAAAIGIQWRQSIKDRDLYRKDIKELKEAFNQALEKNTSVISDIASLMRELNVKYDSDRKHGNTSSSD